MSNRLLLLSALLVTACASNDDKPVYQAPEKAVVLERSSKDRAQSLTELGMAYYQLGKYNYAMENLERSLSIDAKNALTYQLIALINVRKKLPDQAETFFNKAMKLAPQDYDIVTDYAVFLYAEQRHTEAKAEFQRIIDAPFYKKKWVAYSYLGLYDLQDLQYKQAEMKFHKALQINAKYPIALLEMAKIRYRKGNVMSARGFIERYFGVAGKTLEGLQLAIKIEKALQAQDMVEQYQLELKRAFPFSDAAEQLDAL